MDIKAFVREQVDYTHDDTGKELTRQLRAKAQERSWPFDIARRLRVIYDYDTDSYTVAYPQGLKRKIEDIEYGTQQVPPNPVIRPFMNKMPYFTNKATQDFEEELLGGIDLGD